MSNELTIHQPSPALIPYNEIAQMGRVMAASKLFGIQNEQQAIALMLLCQSENMHPAVAMRDFHIISGRPAMKADAMLSRFKAAGGKVKWNSYTDECVEGTFTAPDGDSITVDWTPERVKKAQLAGNQMHNKFPRQMLKARVISEAIRAIYPGVLSGLYAPEEVREFAGPAETSGPNRTEPEPEAIPEVEPTVIPPGLQKSLNDCKTVNDCRVWLPAARQQWGVKPKSAAYQLLIEAGKKRADEILAAMKQVKEPEPEPQAPDASEPELEPEAHELEAEAAQ